MSGWGSFQPALMYAPVELGQTDGLTLDQHTKLGDQLVEVREAALNIGTVANAERLGYRLNGERWEGRGYEYLLWDQFSTFDINKPTMAVFPDTKPDTKIASVAYQVLGTREAGPPKVFDLSVVPWHHHFDLCKKDGQIVGSNKTDLCKEMGGVPQPQLDHWMVDFWVVPGWENPWGLVSSFHPDLFTENRPWDPEAAKKQEELKSHH